jgi:hypothetical protein
VPFEKVALDGRVRDSVHFSIVDTGLPHLEASLEKRLGA